MSTYPGSGIRMVPSLGFIKYLIELFLPHQDINRVFDIFLDTINQQFIIEKFTTLLPDLNLIYYPSKLKKVIQDSNTNSSSYDLNFNTCLLIFKQLLKSQGYVIRIKSTHTMKKEARVMTIIPPASY
jgi:hypothetical protein